MLGREAYATDEDWLDAIDLEVGIEERCRRVLEWIGEAMPAARQRHDRDGDWEDQAVLLADAVLRLGCDDDVAEVLDRFADTPGHTAPETPHPRESRKASGE